MEIDYKAIQKRLDVGKVIAEILSSQIHPWEIGYKSSKNDSEDYMYVRYLIRSKDIRWGLRVSIRVPYAWTKMNPLVLFTALVRHELSLSSIALHGKLCSKCEALRAMRRKGRSRILPEESSGS